MKIKGSLRSTVFLFLFFSCKAQQDFSRASFPFFPPPPLPRLRGKECGEDIALRPHLPFLPFPLQGLSFSPVETRDIRVRSTPGDPRPFLFPPFSFPFLFFPFSNGKMIEKIQFPVGLPPLPPPLLRTFPSSFLPD